MIQTCQLHNSHFDPQLSFTQKSHLIQWHPAPMRQIYMHPEIEKEIFILQQPATAAICILQMCSIAITYLFSSKGNQLPPDGKHIHFCATLLFSKLFCFCTFLSFSPPRRGPAPPKQKQKLNGRNVSRFLHSLSKSMQS